VAERAPPVRGLGRQAKAGPVKVSRRRGRIRLQLEPIEADLLRSLFGELSEALDADAVDSDDPVWQRLHPAGYRDDDAAAAEFRRLTEPALDTERVARLAQCLADLEHGAVSGGLVEMDAEGGERWLKALNDLRLALGTRLGVTEDELLEPSPGREREPEPDAAPAHEVYVWLTAVQDSLVHAVMR
jgi:Domain of unknown function (DUF2017)